jgi:hypothetical protein
MKSLSDNTDSHFISNIRAWHTRLSLLKYLTLKRSVRTRINSLGLEIRRFIIISSLIALLLHLNIFMITRTQEKSIDAISRDDMPTASQPYSNTGMHLDFVSWTSTSSVHVGLYIKTVWINVFEKNSSVVYNTTWGLNNEIQQLYTLLITFFQTI